MAYRRSMSFRRALFNVEQRAQALGCRLRGARVKRLLIGLGKRQPYVQSGRVYVGTDRLGELGGQSGRSVQRALPEAEELGVLIERPNGGRGGKVLDESGHPVGAANGYELAPEFFGTVREIKVAESVEERPPAGRPAGWQQVMKAAAELRAPP